MKRFRKFLLWVVLPLVVLLTIVAVVLGMMISSFLTRDAIAARIESEKNCRVSIGSVDASLLGGKVVLTDLVLSPRDDHASAGTPLDERPPAAPDQTGVRVKRVELNATLGDLLKRKLTVKDLTIEGLDVGFLIEEDNTTLDQLFDPPEKVDGEPNPHYEAKMQRRELAKQRRKLNPDDPGAAELAEKIRGFNIGELPLPATMEKLQIKDGVVNMKIRKDKTRIRLYDVQLTLSELDFDPGDMKNHNGAHLDLDCRLNVTDRERVNVYAELDLHGEGDIVPFDQETGFLNPNLATAVTIRKGSEIFSLPLVEKLAAALDKLKSVGLNVSDLENTLVVAEDATVQLGWRDGMLRTVDPLAINLNGHELVMAEESWLHTGSNEHEINGELTFSEQISNSTFNRANETLAKLEFIDPETLKGIADMLFKPVTKNSRLYLPFVSTGDFGKPKVRPRVELMGLSDIKKSLAKDGALNLLDQLIKGE